MKEKKYNILGFNVFTQRKFEDESRERADVCQKGLAKGLWPVADKYRISKFPVSTFYKLGLEAFYNGEWVTVEEYNDGYDEYGRLRDGQWVGIHTTCMWDNESLERIARSLLGSEPEIKPMKVIT